MPPSEVLAKVLGGGTGSKRRPQGDERNAGARYGAFGRPWAANAR